MYNTEAKQPYSDLLRGSFKALGHFADEALQKSSAHEFFKVLCENIVPLIIKSEAFDPLRLEWTKGKESFQKERAKTEKKAIKEISSTFLKLKSILNSESLIEIPIINKAISSIEDILEFREVYTMPAYYEIAYDRLKELCYRVLELGRVDLVSDLGEIIYIEKTHVDKTTYEVTSTRDPSFLRFTFTPSRSNLCKLDENFSWDKIVYPWVLWDYLDLARWCWQIPFSYFEDKKLKHKNAESCSQSKFLLNSHTFWVALHTIKNNSHTQIDPYRFKLSRFKNYLNCLLNSILLHQEVHGIANFSTCKPSPHSIEIDLNDNKLLLHVEWLVDGIVETYLIHKFTDDSAIKKFTLNLLASEPEKILSIENLASGLSISKYLDRTKLKGILSNVFLTQKSGYKTALRSKRVFLSEVPKINLIKLQELIKSLERL